MNIDEIALRDAWTAAKECGQELAAIVDELSEVARERWKIIEWDQAIKRLGRAERASQLAAETLAGLIPANDEGESVERIDQIG